MPNLSDAVQSAVDDFQGGSSFKCADCGSTFTNMETCLHVDEDREGNITKYCSDCYRASHA